MDKVLHQGATRVVSERSGARRRALVCSGKSAIYIGQAGFAPSGLIRSGALAITIAATIFGQTADAQDLKRGEALLARNCASCHAVGRTGDSPQKLAPTFRSLGQRYPIESLEEALGEGIMSGHPDMPEFSFDAADVGAIIAYLKSIQQR
jgi:mono/diheme cytochrome c family protein